jgi:hypothetical protein
MKTITELKKEIERVNKEITYRHENSEYYDKEWNNRFKNHEKELQALLQQSKDIIEIIDNSNWISERIKAEYRKHHKTEDLFEKTTEAKIKAQLKSKIIGSEEKT